MSVELFIEEKDINNEKILEIFKTAFLDANLTEKGAVHIDDRLNTLIAVDEGYKRLYIHTYGPVKKSIDELELLRWINDANFEKPYVRFFLDKEHDLMLDYYLSYKGGLTSLQIVESYRKFCMVGEEMISKLNAMGYISKD
jgi:FMN phosphatase YigB (HAD superfamily)